jgi:hypothetical protein
MSQFFKRLLGIILLITTVGLATCQALVKAESMTTIRHDLLQ